MATGSAAANASEDSQQNYFECFFTKLSKKKHKVWDDGILVIKQANMELQRDDGSLVTKSKNSSKQLEAGSTLFMGTFEVRVAVMSVWCIRVTCMCSAF